MTSRLSQQTRDEQKHKLYNVSNNDCSNFLVSKKMRIESISNSIPEINDYDDSNLISDQQNIKYNAISKSSSISTASDSQRDISYTKSFVAENSIHLYTDDNVNLSNHDDTIDTNNAMYKSENTDEMQLCQNIRNHKDVNIAMNGLYVDGIDAEGDSNDSYHGNTIRATQVSCMTYDSVHSDAETIDQDYRQPKAMAKIVSTLPLYLTHHEEEYKKQEISGCLSKINRIEDASTVTELHTHSTNSNKTQQYSEKQLPCDLKVIPINTSHTLDSMTDAITTSIINSLTTDDINESYNIVCRSNNAVKRPMIQNEYSLKKTKDIHSSDRFKESLPIRSTDLDNVTIPTQLYNRDTTSQRSPCNITRQSTAYDFNITQPNHLLRNSQTKALHKTTSSDSVTNKSRGCIFNRIPTYIAHSTSNDDPSTQEFTTINLVNISLETPETITSQKRTVNPRKLTMRNNGATKRKTTRKMTPQSKKSTICAPKLSKILDNRLSQVIYN